MHNDVGLLRADGAEIVDSEGRPVRLRGFCLGGWLNMENFITGYPGTESGLRASVAAVLGEEKARFFFERFLTHFVAEDDVRFMKGMGATVVRVPLNYRHFEDDDRPHEWKEDGFVFLDRLVEWCRAHGLYVILDLHAAQGWQNPDWHSDNPGAPALLWQHRQFQDRFVALWEEFACRYRDDPIIAGYNVLNEPVTDDWGALNGLYRRVVAAIRAIDPAHILFLEGNMYSTRFERLDPPLDTNTVYSSHNYVLPGLADAPYPGTIGGKMFDRTRLAEDYDEGNAYMRRHDVPTWVGEFGSNYLGGQHDDQRVRVVDDLIDIMEERGHHWTTWTYKDIGIMGSVNVDPNSPWMRRIRPVLTMYNELGCDTWYMHGGEVDELLSRLVRVSKRICAGRGLDEERLLSQLRHSVRGTVLPQALLPLFAEQFRGMDENEIDGMMASFRIERCVERKPLVEVLTKHMRRSASRAPALSPAEPGGAA